jgi:hypothetical protein
MKESTPEQPKAPTHLSSQLLTGTETLLSPAPTSVSNMNTSDLIRAFVNVMWGSSRFHVYRSTLQKGRSAEEAAIAVPLCHRVSHPHGCGLDGRLSTGMCHRSNRTAFAQDARKAAHVKSSTDVFQHDEARSGRGELLYIARLPIFTLVTGVNCRSLLFPRQMLGWNPSVQFVFLLRRFSGNSNYR